MPLDSPAPQRPDKARNGLFEAMMARVPQPVRDGFSKAQISALEEASKTVDWGKSPSRHPAFDPRIAWPLLSGRSRRKGTPQQGPNCGGKKSAIQYIVSAITSSSRPLVALGVYMVVFTEMLYFVAHFAGLLD